MKVLLYFVKRVFAGLLVIAGVVGTVAVLGAVVIRYDTVGIQLAEWLLGALLVSIASIVLFTIGESILD